MTEELGGQGTVVMLLHRGGGSFQAQVGDLRLSLGFLLASICLLLFALGMLLRAPEISHTSLTPISMLLMTLETYQGSLSPSAHHGVAS